MTISIGFIVNPIAGMGGRVGLKGTDGVVKKAIALGAHPVSIDRSIQSLSSFVLMSSEDITWYTCTMNMTMIVLI